MGMHGGGLDPRQLPQLARIDLGPSRCQDETGSPVKADGCPPWHSLEMSNETIDPRLMALRPVRLRQHVVADVEPAGSHKRQRGVQPFVLSGHRVGENEIEGLRRLSVQVR